MSNIRTIPGHRYPRTPERQMEARLRAHENGAPPPDMRIPSTRIHLPRLYGERTRRDFGTKGERIARKSVSIPLPDATEIRWSTRNSFHLEADRARLKQVLVALKRRRPAFGLFYQKLLDALSECPLQRVELHHAGVEIPEGGKKRSTYMKVRVQELGGQEFVLPKNFFKELQ